MLVEQVVRFYAVLPTAVYDVIVTVDCVMKTNVAEDPLRARPKTEMEPDGGGIDTTIAADGFLVVSIAHLWTQRSKLCYP